MKILKARRTSSSSHTDEAAAQKVLKVSKICLFSVKMKGMIIICLQGLADVAEQRDVLLAGAAVEVVPNLDDMVGSPTRKPKRWDMILQRPDLDYSDIFVDEVGTLTGLTIWQIENFAPVEIEEGSDQAIFLFYTSDPCCLEPRYTYMAQLIC